MQYVGFVLVFLGFVGLLIGLLQHLKGKKILAAPFRRTGEIAQNPGVADAKGTISCEGNVVAQQPAIAPCSGTPCIYFEIEVVQKWRRTVITEDGTKTETGKNTVNTIKSGAPFFVDDGSGPVMVDPTQGMDVELDKSFNQGQDVSYGDVYFGQFHCHVPEAGGDRYGTGVECTEKIVPIQGGMFVMGQLVQGQIKKPTGMLGSLKASRKGRAALLGATKRNSIIGFVAGALFFLPGTGLSIFADPPEPTKPGEGACNILDESKGGTPCSGKIYNDDGSDVPLTVSQAGTFEISGGPPRGKKIPVIAALGVKDETGKVLLQNEREHATVDLQPGKYTINIKDSVPGDAAHFKGGFSYELLVKRTKLLPAATASASAIASATASASALPAAPVVKAGGPAVKAGATKPGASAGPGGAAGTAKPAGGAAAASAKKK